MLKLDMGENIQLFFSYIPNNLYTIPINYV